MEEGWGKDELLGVALVKAHETLDSKTITKDGSEVRVDGKQICQIARKVATSVVNGDLEKMVDPMALGGQKVYDKSKFTKACVEAASKTFDEMKAENKLKPRDMSEKARYRVDICSDQGRRANMEDKHVAFEDLNALVGIEDEGMPEQALFGVYDGHGGVDAAEYTAAQLHLNVTADKSLKDDPIASLQAGFRTTDKNFLMKAEREALTCGATACTVLLRHKALYIAWLGDSQAMLCRAGKDVQLMHPHKPQNEDEKKRIEDNGGVVVWYGAWRVNGILSVARAIGDKKLKQWVIGEPGVGKVDLDGSEEFVVVACDGLWDVMNNEEVITYVKKWQEDNNGKIEGIAKSLVTHCITDLASSDNISCIVVFL